MTIEELFRDTSVKAKAKVSAISGWLVDGELGIEELLAFAEKQKPSGKATCIEAVEYATKKNPEIADENLLAFVTKSLGDKEPRIKWESAKVIGNIAARFPSQLGPSVKRLLPNAENEGTVVRWASAYALAEILKLKTNDSKTLLPKLRLLCEKEENNGVRKKYQDALKQIK